VTELLLFAAALLAGFIDAIAGGGGLILLPALSIVVGAGPSAIGTNKPAALAMAAIALIVYARRGHLNLRLSAAFALMLAIGVVAAAGASTAGPAQLASAVARWIPEARRSMANGIIGPGGSFGQLLIVPIAQLCIGVAGWQPALAIGAKAFHSLPKE